MKFRLPLEFDVKRLLNDLGKVRQDEWIPHYNPNDHQGNWSLAALLAPAGDPTNIYSCALPDICRPTPLLERCDYFHQVLDQLPIKKSSVRLMKLDAGAVIREHCDSLNDDEIRLHIPITTNPQVEFYLADERIEMPAGSCWYLDFRHPHHVKNCGSSSRTHIVIDAYRNDWFGQLNATN